VLATFRTAVADHGVPASTLTDNGLVFTTRFSGGKGGRNHLEHELRERNITQKNGHPNHPQTQGKVERFQQTLKKWLPAQAASPPASRSCRTSSISSSRSTTTDDRTARSRTTPPPANSCATSSSTHDATTSPPVAHPALQRSTPDLQIAGPAHSDVRRHHTVGLTVCN
jgi:hypothetical protein